MSREQMRPFLCSCMLGLYSVGPEHQRMIVHFKQSKALMCWCIGGDCMQLLTRMQITVAINAAELQLCVLKQNSRIRLCTVHRRLSYTISSCTIWAHARLNRSSSMIQAACPGQDFTRVTHCISCGIHIDLFKVKGTLLWAAYSSLDSRLLTIRPSRWANHML